MLGLIQKLHIVNRTIGLHTSVFLSLMTIWHAFSKHKQLRCLKFEERNVFSEKSVHITVWPNTKLTLVRHPMSMPILTV